MKTPIAFPPLPGRDGPTTYKAWARMSFDLLSDAPQHRVWLEGMAYLSRQTPARLSFRQIVALQFVFHAAAAGRQVTMTDVRSFFELLGGSEGVGQSLAKSFQIFLEPSKQEPNGLSWVLQESDEDDRRKKYLRLTPEGAEVAKEWATIMSAAPPVEVTVNGR